MTRPEERLEALTQTVELLAAMQQENERRMGQMMDAINRLTNIAAASRRAPGSFSRHVSLLLCFG